MEGKQNEKRQSNTALVVALTIFITLTVVLGGYLVYDKSTNKTSENNKSSEIDNEVKKENEDYKVSETVADFSVTHFYPDSVAITTNGSVYVSVYGSTHEIDELFSDGTYQKLFAIVNKYKAYKFDNFEYIGQDNATFKGMKLNVKNIKKVYSFASGQTLQKNYGINLLNEDKTLSMISLYSLILGKTDVKPINGLSNIEKVVTEQNYGTYTYAVDANGKKYDLSKYVPENYKSF